MSTMNCLIIKWNLYINVGHKISKTNTDKITSAKKFLNLLVKLTFKLDLLINILVYIYEFKNL